MTTRDGMTIVRRLPSPVLVPFVDYMVYYETPLAMARDRILPLRSMNLTVNLAEDRMRWYDGAELATAHTRRGAVVFGPRTGPVGIDVPTRRGVRVVFRPGGMFPFLQTPASLLDEPLVELEVLWGRAGAMLRDRLLDAPTPDAVLSSVEGELLRQVVRPLDPDPMVTSAVAMLGRGAAVADVADRLGRTERTLLRRFTAQVGLSPKAFARVLRLHRLIASVPLRQEVDWARAASDYGYFDQPHLINDFRALTGTTPGGFHPRISDPTHIPLTG